MTQLQTILLETLKDLIVFLEKNDIEYFACGGTVLGAVRHRGFIPWDDDIDIYVPRKDYDKLLSLRYTLDESKYKLMCVHDYPYFYPHSRFYNQNYYISSTFDALFHEGPFIDIIPLDEASDDISKTKHIEKSYMGAIKSYRRCIRHLSWNQILYKFMHKEWIMGLREIKRKLFFPHRNKDKYMHSFLEAEKEIRKTHGMFYFCYFHTYPIEKELFRKEIFADHIKMPFESIKIKVPILYHEYLTQLFGNYMQLPPIEKRKTHYGKDRQVKPCSNI